MEMIFDFMLLAASGSAAVYCFVLNRKLQRLKDTEKGLGATIASMAAAVEQAQSAVAQAKLSSAESVNELAPLVAETREFLPKLTTLAESIGGIADTTIANINEAALAATKEIASCLNTVGPVQPASATDDVSAASATVGDDAAFAAGGDNAAFAAGSDNGVSTTNTEPTDAPDQIEFIDPDVSPSPNPPRSAAGAAGAWIAASRSTG